MYKLLLVDPDLQFIKQITCEVAWHEIGVAQVITANNGNSALRIAQEEKPELVICEIQLPDQSGHDWVKLILNKEYPQKVAFLSEQWDFQAIRESIKLKAVDHLLKPVSHEQVKDVVLRMISELEQHRNINLQMWIKARVLLQRNFIESLLKGTMFYSTQTFDENVQPLQLEWLQTLPCTVMVVELTGYKDAIIDWKDQDLIKFAVDNLLIELSEHLDHTVLLPQEKTRWIVVAGLSSEFIQNGEESGLTYMQGIAESWIAAIEQYTHARASIGISGLTTQWRELPHLLNQALEALSFNQYMDEKVLRYDMTVANFVDEVDGDIDIKRLLNDLYTGNKAGIRELLKHFPAHILQTSRSGKLSITQRSMEWILDIHRFLEQSGALQRNIIDVSRLEEQFDNVEDELELCSRVIAHFLHLCDLINPSTGNILQKAMDYMVSNLSNRIKLEDVAAHLYISPAWLSKLFRTKLDVSFHQYVTQLKIEEAKLLLRHSKTSIQDIAWRLGYEDTVYFSKLFKRVTGVTPTKYRKPF